MWETLRGTDALIYGMGNGALKLLKLCREYNVRVKDIFASDDFARGNEFCGYKIAPMSETLAKYENPAILLAFGSSLPPMLDLFYRLDEKYDFYAPDMPLFGQELFTKAVFERDLGKIYKVYEKLYDDKSRSVFESVLRYKASGRISFLRECESSRQEILEKILPESGLYLDLGAYKGDTIEETLKIMNCDKVIAVEPDAKNFRKLQADFPQAELINAAVWDRDGEVHFSEAGSRGSSVGAEGNLIKSRSVDSILNKRAADYIKIDVEGSELRALSGAENALKRSPALSVSLYHRCCDIYELPLRVLDINPEYRIMIRHHPYVPAWETNLYAF